MIESFVLTPGFAALALGLEEVDIIAVAKARHGRMQFPRVAEFKMAEVIVEFYGIPRERAGRAELTVQAATVGDALAAIEQACPGLKDLCAGSILAAHYRLSLEGRQFVTEMQQPLAPGSRLLLMSADAGG